MSRVSQLPKSKRGPTVTFSLCGYEQYVNTRNQVWLCLLQTSLIYADGCIPCGK